MENNGSSASKKRNRIELEKNNSSTNDVSEAEVLKRLSLGIGSIATDFNKMYSLMEKRESRDKECWDALMKTPNLDDETRYTAYELLNTKALKDLFLNMSKEQRFKWFEMKTKQ